MKRSSKLCFKPVFACYKQSRSKMIALWICDAIFAQLVTINKIKEVFIAIPSIYHHWHRHHLHLYLATVIVVIIIISDAEILWPSVRVCVRSIFHCIIEASVSPSFTLCMYVFERMHGIVRCAINCIPRTAWHDFVFILLLFSIWFHSLWQILRFAFIHILNYAHESHCCKCVLSNGQFHFVSCIPNDNNET